MEAFLAGLVLGTMITLITLQNIPGTIMDNYHKAQDVCEQVIPRNQECVMVFIPENETGK